ncbi:MAG TPA: TIGR04282 family arsenosugar biosynthesis glycosyltransferase [bacterium]|nr:TIGR04282 family arsenosugar biosynthesis glycosyltransferase [bacterium]
MLLNHLLIFAKYPEPGKVKTRLARSVGLERAALLYKEMAETVVVKTAPVNGEYARTLHFDPPEKSRDFEVWFPSLAIKPQCAGDLGLRMKSAIEESFRSGADRVVLIGSDCPDLDRPLVLESFRKLESSDLVIGPATDGGYYLIGMSRRGLARQAPALFDGVLWSTASVLRETLEKAEKIGIPYALLPTLSDVDEIA